MAYTAPISYSGGGIGTAAFMNTYVRDNILYLADRVDNPPRARVTHNTTQSLANGTGTLVAFNTEVTDSAALHDTVTNNNRLTIPSGQGGLWLVAATITFEANATGQRIIIIQDSSAIAVAAATVDAAAGANTTRLPAAGLYTIGAGDYFTVVASQNSGGALNLAASSSFFMAQRIS